MKQAHECHMRRDHLNIGWVDLREVVGYDVIHSNDALIARLFEFLIYLAFQVAFEISDTLLLFQALLDFFLNRWSLHVEARKSIHEIRLLRSQLHHWTSVLQVISRYFIFDFNHRGLSRE